MAESPTTAFLAERGRSDASAARELIARMQPELWRIAHNYMRRERAGHTLQPTALVNELFVRMMSGEPVSWQGRAHFLAMASIQLRRILVDHAREHLAAKRGGGLRRTTLSGRASAEAPLEAEILDLHRALEELAAMDPRTGQVVELRYFGGLSEAETAESLKISVATVKRDWTVGRAWLISRLSGRDKPGLSGGPAH